MSGDLEHVALIAASLQPSHEGWTDARAGSTAFHHKNTSLLLDLDTHTPEWRSFEPRDMDSTTNAVSTSPTSQPPLIELNLIHELANLCLTSMLPSSSTVSPNKVQA